MTAYYNENEPYAAQWLRNLIDAGLIAPGDVDDRSILDVRADDLRGYTQCHFFAGIGVWSYALRLAGFPDGRPIWTASCPCQPFSVAGAGKADADERHLWPAVAALIGECRPELVIGEQVAGSLGLAWFDHVRADLETLDYAAGLAVFPAAGVGAPHQRHRLYWVANTDADGWNWGGEARLHERRTAPSGDELAQRSADGPRGHDADRCGESGGVAITGCEQCGAGSGRWPAESRAGPHAQPTGSSDARIVGDAERARLEGLAGDVDDGHEPRRQRARSHGSTPAAGALGIVGDAERIGYTIGGQRQAPGDAVRTDPRQAPGTASHASFWSDCEWIACRDGKARPTEPGSPPLVAGIAKRMGCVCAHCQTETVIHEGLQFLRKVGRGYEGRREEALLRFRMLSKASALVPREEQEFRAFQGASRQARERVRAMRLDGALAGASQGQESVERFPLEPGNLVSVMSYTGAQLDQAVGVRGLWLDVQSGVAPEPQQDLFCIVCERVGPHLCGEEAGPSRVGMLKGFGNSLCAPQAQAFIEACMGVLP